MNRILFVVMVLLIAVSAGAADHVARDPEQISIATTGRIIKIDSKHKLIRVRGSDCQTFSLRSVSQNFGQMMQGVKQRMGVTLPGGITIALPGRGKSSSKTEERNNNLEEFSVVVTDDTLFQDGSDSIRFEDFKSGEVISIHGVLSGSSAVTASRIAKWF
jgi:hypothetical protein